MAQRIDIRFTGDDFEKAMGRGGFEEAMEEMARDLNLGDTGEYPDGKIANHDEGELRMAVLNYMENVIINFGKPVKFIAMGASAARALGQLLIDRARDAEAAEASNKEGDSEQG